MPPRSAKKAAAKRSSPRSKRSPLATPASASASALPTVEEEEKVLDAQASPAAAAPENNIEGKDEKSLEPESSLLEADAGPRASPAGEAEGMEAKTAAAEVLASAAVAEDEPPETEGMGRLGATEKEIKGKAVDPEGSVPGEDASTSPTANGDVEGLKEDKVAAAEVLDSDTVEEVAPRETEDMEEADVMQEDVQGVEASVRTEVEPLAVQETTGGEKHPEIVSEVKDNSCNSKEVNIEEGAKKTIIEKGTVASGVEGTETCGFEVGDAGDTRSGTDDDLDNGEDEDEVDPSLYMNAPMAERKRNKELEIFVGGLGKEAVEDDLLKVFGEFGEIQSARIVKHPVTQKSKGFAFIRYATVEQAKKALTELKDGTEIRGKRVGISASVDNDTLYLGNICKTWTKDQVLETLRGFGVEPLKEILLPDDPKKEGSNKGFAFLEFGSHSDAMAAFQRLRKPDAIFGCNRSAKVSFAQFSLHPSEEVMSQVKSVYVEGLGLTWHEEKVKEMCKQYGEIEKVLLSRNFSKKKRKDFGFVAFTSHESAVACVEGINNAEFGGEDIKVKASLAKPQKKGRLAKQGVRGGFKVKKNGEVEKEADQSKAKDQSKAEERHEKGKAPPKLKRPKDKKPSKSKGKVTGGKSNAQYRQNNVERLRDGKRGRKDMVVDKGARPSKKARRDFKVYGRPSGGFGSQRSAHFGMMSTSDMMDPIAYASGYAEPATGYQLYGYAGASESKHQHSDQLYGYAGASESKHQHSDLEPHAGYLPASRHGLNQYGYAQRSVDAYGNQQRIGAGAYHNQESTTAVAYGNQQRIYSGGYSNQQRSIVDGYSNVERIGAGYLGAGSEQRSSYAGHSTYGGHEAGYPYLSTGAYAPQGRYY